MDTSNAGDPKPRPGPVRSAASARVSEPDTSADSQVGRANTIAHSLLLLLAVGLAWFPVESRPFSAVIVAVAVLALCQWGWRRAGSDSVPELVIGALVLGVLVCSAVSGWDPSRAVGEIGLAAAAGTLVWLASRSKPPEGYPVFLAIGIAGLAIWGIWQAFSGLEALRPGIEDLASPARAYAEERVASRRAFASLPLPSHLAVLLATAVPLLLARVRATPRGMVWLSVVILATIGLIATRSPIGLGLALVAVAPVLLSERRMATHLVMGGLVVAMIAVVVARPDVTKLEPFSLRFDNWRSGVWLWTTSPASGVGVGSFAQASQANPLVVGNRPAHAHSLPVEGLAEMGPVGLTGVMFFGVWLLQLTRNLWRDDRSLAAAIVVVPLHNLLDFSIFVSGVVLPWAVLIGWACARSSSEAVPVRFAPSSGRTVLITAAAMALGMTFMHASSVVVEEAAAGSARPEEQFDGALQALRMAPWRVRPQFLLATSAIVSRDRSLQNRAWDELDRLRWLRPRSAALAQRRSRLALARGDVSIALAELWTGSVYGVSGSGSERAFSELVEGLERASDESAR